MPNPTSNSFSSFFLTDIDRFVLHVWCLTFRVFGSCYSAPSLRDMESMLFNSGLCCPRPAWPKGMVRNGLSFSCKSYKADKDVQTLAISCCNLPGSGAALQALGIASLPTFCKASAWKIADRY